MPVRAVRRAISGLSGKLLGDHLYAKLLALQDIYRHALATQQAADSDGGDVMVIAGGSA